MIIRTAERFPDEVRCLLTAFGQRDLRLVRPAGPNLRFLWWTVPLSWPMRSHLGSPPTPFTYRNFSYAKFDLTIKCPLFVTLTVHCGDNNGNPALPPNHPTGDIFCNPMSLLWKETR